MARNNSTLSPDLVEKITSWLALPGKLSLSVSDARVPEGTEEVAHEGFLA